MVYTTGCFINALGKRAIVSDMEHPQNEHSSLLDAFEYSFEHERKVTKRFHELSDREDGTTLTQS